MTAGDFKFLDVLLHKEYRLKMLKCVCAASINMKADEDREAEK